MSNNETLKQIKIDYGLTTEGIAKLTGWKVATISSYLADPEGSNYRALPGYRMDYLRYKLKSRKKASV